jgi:hypothetical protein
MKYNVSINEAKRSITVTLADGTKGVARCCPTDRFDINTGIELALERAKVAQRVAQTPVKTPSVMELVKALEKALPKGQMVLVGNGKELTDNQKKWLASLAGVPTKCNCSCCDCDEGDYESGYDDGYEDGYADAMAEVEESDEMDTTALARIREILEEVGAI